MLLLMLALVLPFRSVIREKKKKEKCASSHLRLFPAVRSTGVANTNMQKDNVDLATQ